MVLTTKIKKNTYHDSVLLMQIANKLKDLEGVSDTAIMIGTNQNKEALRLSGLYTKEIDDATPNDLFFVVKADTLEIGENALEVAEDLISNQRYSQVADDDVAKSIGTAKQLLPDSNLALISIPGSFVKREAMKALEEGLNLLIFSSNVPIEDELEIKKIADSKGLLVMGPDCGTAIIGGAALGFANSVRKGSIGVVGASGTGIQEITCLVHQLGEGITHAIGTGSNDVSEKVGAATMIRGLEILDQDPNTRVIVVVSKPPAYEAQEKILKMVKTLGKPTVICFIGGDPSLIQDYDLNFARTLEEAALKAVTLVTGKTLEIENFSIGKTEWMKIAEREFRRLDSHQKFVRGLFSGGTFSNESATILLELFQKVHTNSTLRGALKLRDPLKSIEHTCLDIGAEEFTLGKPHPMLEPNMRIDFLLKEARDPETAVVLLDFVLGHGVHQDPAGAFIHTILEARELARAEGRYLPIVCSVCGTNEDPQNRSQQIKKLEEAGVIVMPSNAQATMMSALIATRGMWKKGR
jgi:succinyl-CoA synthetase alpha subunit